MNAIIVGTAGNSWVARSSGITTTTRITTRWITIATILEASERSRSGRSCVPVIRSNMNPSYHPRALTYPCRSFIDDNVTFVSHRREASQLQVYGSSWKETVQKSTPV
jgi:hypothetical protein